MVSAFVCECHGLLKIDKAHDSTRIVQPGNGSWWACTYLVAQVKAAIPISEQMHPDCVALFQFDGSPNHRAFADDALRVENMSLWAGGGEKLRSTTFGPDRIPQSMCFPDDFDNEGVEGSSVKLWAGQSKGLRIVLEERGLWVDGLKLTCKTNSREPDGAESRAHTPCCARHLMATQPDFQKQEPWIDETIHSHGHKVIVLPKSHCELNFIEGFWRDARQFTKDHGLNSLLDLKEVLPRALNQAGDVQRVRRHAQASWKNMRAYRRGMAFTDVMAIAMEEHSSHRKSCGAVDAVLDEDDTADTDSECEPGCDVDSDSGW